MPVLTESKITYPTKITALKPTLSSAPPDFDASFLESLVFDIEPSVTSMTVPLLDKMMDQVTAPATIAKKSLGNKKQETYQMPVDDVKEAIDSLSKNMNKFEWLARNIQNQAIALREACLGNDGHGTQTNTLSVSNEISLSNTNNLSKIGSSHETGKHDHCSHGNDYGSCPEGCEKAA